uniref:ATP synthase F0 subunit 8 n=1 Tax=Anodontites trapesialis TaxID=1961152 RepID=A0A1X9JI61_9BIVA|nr:ATP synthase F0 subunit 8 [Anodontites trapesialis]
MPQLSPMSWLLVFISVCFLFFCWCLGLLGGVGVSMILLV